MRIIDIVLRNLARRKGKTIILLLVNFVMVLFLQIYFSSIQQVLLQIDNVSQNIAVDCNISNRDGTGNAGLRIKAEVKNAIFDSGYATDLHCTSVLYADLNNFNKIPFRDLNITATNKIASSPTFEESTIYLAGYNSSAFQSNMPYLLVDNDFLLSNNLELGDEISLALYGVEYSEETGSRFANLCIVKMKIIGSFSSFGTTQVDISNAFCPLAFAEEICANKDVPIIYDSLSFKLAPGAHLNDFKKFMGKIGLKEIVVAPDENDETGVFDTTAGDYLNVNDETYIKSTSQLKSNLNSLYMFIPVLLIFVFFIAFLIAYYLISSRLRELAIMMSLGETKCDCLKQYLLESFFIFVLGFFPAMLAYVFIPFSSIVVALLLFTSITIINILGTISSYNFTIRFNFFELLTKSD